MHLPTAFRCFSRCSSARSLRRKDMFGYVYSRSQRVALRTAALSGCRLPCSDTKPRVCPNRRSSPNETYTRQFPRAVSSARTGSLRAGSKETLVVTTMVTSSARQRVAKSLESESASIVVILGGFAVVAASILGAGLTSTTPTPDATLAVATAQAVDVEHRNGIAAGSAIGSPIAATTDLDHGAEQLPRRCRLLVEGHRGHGHAGGDRRRHAELDRDSVTDGGPATPAPPRHSEWWWMPVGLVTAGATVTGATGWVAASPGRVEVRSRGRRGDLTRAATGGRTTAAGRWSRPRVSPDPR